MLLGLNARPVKRLSGFLADGNLGGLAALAADVDAGSKVVIVDAYTSNVNRLSADKDPANNALLFTH